MYLANDISSAVWCRTEKHGSQHFKVLIITEKYNFPCHYKNKLVILFERSLCKQFYRYELKSHICWTCYVVTMKRKHSKLYQQPSGKFTWFISSQINCLVTHKRYYQVSTITTHLYNILRRWSRWVTKHQHKVAVTH